jgi:hypothetical protein
MIVASYAAVQRILVAIGSVARERLGDLPAVLDVEKLG